MIETDMLRDLACSLNNPLGFMVVSIGADLLCTVPPDDVKHHSDMPEHGRTGHLPRTTPSGSMAPRMAILLVAFTAFPLF